VHICLKYIVFCDYGGIAYLLEGEDEADEADDEEAERGEEVVRHLDAENSVGNAAIGEENRCEEPVPVLGAEQGDVHLFLSCHMSIEVKQ